MATSDQWAGVLGEGRGRTGPDPFTTPGAEWYVVEFYDFESTEDEHSERFLDFEEACAWGELRLAQLRQTPGTTWEAGVEVICVDDRGQLGVAEFVDLS